MTVPAAELHRFLMGFDIRLPRQDYIAVDWTEKRRKDYLLRADASWPMSVDHSVWPSIFWFDEVPKRVARQHQSIAVSLAREPQLGTDLADLISLYEAGGGKNAIAIALELVTERVPKGSYITYEERPGSGPFGLEIPLTKPERLPVDSEFLGYDIADAARISGLSNCGYTSEDKRQLLGWEMRLNDFGLFPDLQDAIAFRAVTDKRVSEHAPFWIFGIYRLKGTVLN
jgi:hypothetical protein